MEFIKQSVNCNADDEEHNITFEHDYTDEFGFYSFTLDNVFNYIDDIRYNANKDIYKNKKEK
ncbi:MAG: hypothetical protein GX265_00335 [Mollicutes bacterium]|nr:hypothetical protein [Mollicutes bacterium]